jgi:tetratricopeptide (TPR) repeat protein
LLHLEQYDKAVSDFSEAIRLKSDFAPAYCSRGLAKVQLGRYEDALGDYDRGVAIDPKQTYCRSNRGRLYLLTGRYPKAVDDLSMALNNSRLDAGRGQAYEALGQKDRALEDYRAALVLDPSLKEAREGINRLGED